MSGKPQYRIAIYNSASQVDMDMYMKVRTELLDDSSNKHLVKEDTEWSRTGDYIIALHWIEEGPSLDDKKKLMQMLDGG